MCSRSCSPPAAASRFAGSGHKLLAERDGRTVVEHAVDAAVAQALGEVLVVTGAARLPMR